MYTMQNIEIQIIAFSYDMFFKHFTYSDREYSNRFTEEIIIVTCTIYIRFFKNMSTLIDNSC